MAIEEAPRNVTLVPHRRGPERSPTARTPTVERAKGLLMFRHGIASFEAFALLLRYARQQDLDLTSAAERLVDGVDLQEIRPDAGSGRGEGSQF